MIEIIIKNEINNMEAYLPLAKEFVADSKCDAGCLGMTILVQPDDPTHVTFVSRWERKSDFEAHCAGHSFQKHIPRLTPYYVGGHEEFYEVVE